jgi:hypothetical protein
MKGNSVNIEEIMDEIRADIKKKGYTDDVLNFDDADIAYIRDQWHIQINTGTDNNFILKRLIKKIIKKLSLFIVSPIIEHQSHFNLSVSKILIDDIKKEQELLKGKIENLTSLLTDIKNKS